MWSPLKSSQGPSLRCHAPETAKGAADTASLHAAAAQRRTSEAGEFGAVLAPRPRGGRLVRPGKFFRRRGWRRRLRDLALTETCRDELAERQRNRPLGSPPEHFTQASPSGGLGLGDLTPRAQACRRDAALSQPDQSRRNGHDALGAAGWRSHQAARPTSISRSGRPSLANGLRCRLVKLDPTIRPRMAPHISHCGSRPPANGEAEGRRRRGELTNLL
jgi:hypothetical protein